MSTMNRLANCHNKFQGQVKKVLCVCSAGVLRSPTAAIVLQRDLGYNTRSAGLNDEYALIPVDDVLIEWADEVVVMESWMYHELETKPCKVLICLDIEDRFQYMDPELQETILQNYKEKKCGQNERHVD